MRVVPNDLNVIERVIFKDIHGNFLMSLFSFVLQLEKKTALNYIQNIGANSLQRPIIKIPNLILTRL